MKLKLKLDCYYLRPDVISTAQQQCNVRRSYVCFEVHTTSIEKKLPSPLPLGLATDLCAASVKLMWPQHSRLQRLKNAHCNAIGNVDEA